MLGLFSTSSSTLLLCELTFLTTPWCSCALSCGPHWSENYIASPAVFCIGSCAALFLGGPQHFFPNELGARICPFLEPGMFVLGALTAWWIPAHLWSLVQCGRCWVFLGPGHLCYARGLCEQRGEIDEVITLIYQLHFRPAIPQLIYVSPRPPNFILTATLWGRHVRKASRNTTVGVGPRLPTGD